MSNFNSTLSRSLGPSSIGISSREMDSLFDRLCYQNGSATSRQWTLPLSMYEEGECFYLEMETPGVGPDDIELTFEDGRLVATVKRCRNEDDGRNYLHDERCWGEARRLISIPDSVDPESIQANYRDGVLHVQFAKRPEVLPKKIPVTTQ